MHTCLNIHVQHNMLYYSIYCAGIGAAPLHWFRSDTAGCRKILPYLSWMLIIIIFSLVWSLQMHALNVSLHMEGSVFQFQSFTIRFYDRHTKLSGSWLFDEIILLCVMHGIIITVAMITCHLYQRCALHGTTLLSLLPSYSSAPFLWDKVVNSEYPGRTAVPLWK